MFSTITRGLSTGSTSISSEWHASTSAVDDAPNPSGYRIRNVEGSIRPFCETRWTVPRIPWAHQRLFSFEAVRKNFPVARRGAVLVLSKNSNVLKILAFRRFRTERRLGSAFLVVSKNTNEPKSVIPEGVFVARKNYRSAPGSREAIRQSDLRSQVIR